MYAFRRYRLKQDGTREEECRMGSQTLDGHQRTAGPRRTWTNPSSPIIKFEAHFPVSSSQHFKLLYAFMRYRLRQDGTREEECRMGSQTLDGHQLTAFLSRRRTYPSSPIIKFEAHFPVSSSQHFKLLYAFRRYHPKQDGTLEQECRMGSQTLDGHQPTAQSSRRWT